MTGVDLVAWQIRIARGEPLDLRVEPRGHAIEVRLYAEDPRTFLPQAGRIERLRLPSSIRVDAGVAEGDEVGTAYDPLLAKLIAHGDTRLDALDAPARRARGDGGRRRHDQPPLPALARRAPGAARRRDDDGVPRRAPAALGAAGRARRRRRGATPFRLNLPAPPPAPPPDIDAEAHRHGPSDERSALTAPMPGTVIRVLVHEGVTVRARQPLVVLEAMKMETPLASPYDATVRAVHVEEGDRVAGGAVLVELDE